MEVICWLESAIPDKGARCRVGTASAGEMALVKDLPVTCSTKDMRSIRQGEVYLGAQVKAEKVGLQLVALPPPFLALVEELIIPIAAKLVQTAHGTSASVARPHVVLQRVDLFHAVRQLSLACLAAGQLRPMPQLAPRE